MTTGTWLVVSSRRDVEPTAGHRLASNPAPEPLRQTAGPAVTNSEENHPE